ncbi:MAG: nucleotidyltransferase family protein [Clostridia bacterium]|nr:nucleotidyltransferase family protein [Clostridia bacterium]
MQGIGVIAEYNPFHNGHAYQLVEARRMHGGSVVCVMSGDFVQRGEPALISKHLRARHALLHGADMVLEMPAVFSLSSAQRFAACGIRMLQATGIVNAVCFGSEHGDIALLTEAARRLNDESPAFTAALQAQLKTGQSYPSAFAKAVDSPYDFGPNDVLGVEYIRAILSQSADLQPVCVRRIGAAHDALDASGGYASASAIRKQILCGDLQSFSGCMPPDVLQDLHSAIPRTQHQLSTVILYALRRMDQSALAALPDVREGLENVLYREARRQTTYEAFLFACKTKRYTLSRLRRISMCALLGITADMLTFSPYIRVLGLRQSAKPLLAQMCDASTLPVVTRFSQAAALPAHAAKLHAIDMLAGEVAAMASLFPTPALFDYASPLLVV